jgi:hypothetical protein
MASTATKKQPTKAEPKKLLSLDSASLVDLKAETFRKSQEAKFNLRHGIKGSGNKGDQGRHETICQ